MNGENPEGTGADAPLLLYFKEVSKMLKEVYFKCKKCKHWKKEEEESPCDECLKVWAIEDSHTPLYFEEEIKNEKH